jgi:hypothetical protein
MRDRTEAGDRVRTDDIKLGKLALYPFNAAGEHPTEVTEATDSISFKRDCSTRNESRGIHIYCCHCGEALDDAGIDLCVRCSEIEADSPLVHPQHQTGAEIVWYLVAGGLVIALILLAIVACGGAS